MSDFMWLRRLSAALLLLLRSATRVVAAPGGAAAFDIPLVECDLQRESLQTHDNSGPKHTTPTFCRAR